ncbi:MAG: SDR family NAD(P)-dependent oxidoreductase, partial [Pirellulaceae bacterium]
MDLALKHKTVFLSGASGGIGQAIAQQLAAEGANVVVHFHRNRESADKIVAAIGADQSLAVGGNLSDEATVASAFATTSERFGPIDILVACAGVWPPEHTPIHDMTLTQWNTTLDNNLTSTFLCCRAFIKQAVEHDLQDPAIVLIGSTAAVFGEAGHGDYAASKSGLTYGLMLTLKNEISRVASCGRVNTVCPGWTVTPMAEKFTDDGDSIKQALSTIALRKVASADDIAHAVLFLSSARVAGH